eukprot:792619-Amphidinium_carterae.1
MQILCKRQASQWLQMTKQEIQLKHMGNERKTQSQVKQRKIEAEVQRRVAIKSCYSMNTASPVYCVQLHRQAWAPDRRLSMV